MSELSDAAPRSALRSALTIAGVAFLVMVVQNVIQSLLDAAVVTNRINPGSGTDFGGALAAAMIASTPFGIGVFLSLWQLAPIHRGFELRRVVAAAVGAATIGLLVSVLVVVLVSFGTALAGLPSLFAGAVGDKTGGFGVSFAPEVLTGVLAAVGTAVTEAPLVVLVAVLVWLRLGRHAASEVPEPAPDEPPAVSEESTDATPDTPPTTEL